MISFYQSGPYVRFGKLGTTQGKPYCNLKAMGIHFPQPIFMSIFEKKMNFHRAYVNFWFNSWKLQFWLLCMYLSFFNFSDRTISPELATQSAMLNRQTSRSTEDMFTPVIKKHSKWKNKKAGISNLSKDDSAHTYSSSSSASSTTSSTVAPSSGQNNASYQAASNSHSSILSAKPAK